MSAIHSDSLNDYNWIYKRFDTPHTMPVTVYILFSCGLRHFGGWGGGDVQLLDGVSILGRLSALGERDERLGLWVWARVGIFRNPEELRDGPVTGLFG